MPLTGYMKVPDIKGESYRVDHEDEIDFYNIELQIRQPHAKQGHGRASTSAEVGLIYTYHMMNAADVYLAKSCMTGKPFDEIVYYVRKDSGDAHIDYYTLTLNDALISHYEIIGAPEAAEEGQEMRVKVGCSGRFVKMLYKMQEEDGSVGDEHEIEHDIAAGV